MRVHNFNAGPSTLPEEVLKKVQADLLDYKGAGMSVMEMSHRSPEFSQIIADAKKNLKEIMNINDDYEVLFLQGGASHQFFMFPMNFLTLEKTADYIDTGAWSSKAIKEARLFGNVNVLYSGKDKNYSVLPKWEDLTFTDEAEYCHITSNNTIFGTQFASFPERKGKLIADMSSDIMSRKINVQDFCCIYAGAQKNLGPSGVTVVIMRKDLVEKANAGLPTLLQYKTHIEKESLFNTPPTFAIYIVKMVTDWVKEKGGIDVMEKESRERAGKVYDYVDSTDFYAGTTEKDSRSNTNITFCLKDASLEKTFIEEAKKLKLTGIKGHRSVGGIRISNYNAMPMEGIETLVGFMKNFEKKA